MWQSYKDRGVAVIGIDSPPPQFPPDDARLVSDFVRHAGVTFTVGIEQTRSFVDLVPPKAVDYSVFPLELVVAPDGRIVYMATEYDADAIRRAIDSLLNPP